MSSFFTSIITSVFIVTGIIGLRLYLVKDNKIKTFQTKIKHASIWNDGEPEGWICGLLYIGYISTKTDANGSLKKDMYILCFKKFYSRYINIKTDENINGEKNIVFLEKDGSYWCIDYISRQLKHNFTPNTDQLGIIYQIINDYNKNTYSVPLLYGPTGSGKSMISMLLCNELLKTNDSVTFCDTFNPTDPGDTFINLYQKVKPSNKNPLVVIIEEIDILIDKIHNCIVPHKSIMILVKNKSEWNTFMDRFDRKLYPYVIFGFTTNKTLDYFNSLDQSYMRDGRVTLKINVKNI